MLFHGYVGCRRLRRAHSQHSHRNTGYYASQFFLTLRENQGCSWLPIRPMGGRAGGRREVGEEGSLLFLSAVALVASAPCRSPRWVPSGSLLAFPVLQLYLFHRFPKSSSVCLQHCMFSVFLTGPQLIQHRSKLKSAHQLLSQGPSEGRR